MKFYMQLTNRKAKVCMKLTNRKSNKGIKKKQINLCVAWGIPFQIAIQWDQHYRK